MQGSCISAKMGRCGSSHALLWHMWILLFVARAANLACSVFLIVAAMTKKFLLPFSIACAMFMLHEMSA